MQAARKDKKSISFVPTMGNLHEGHLELVRVAKSRSEFVVVSIYVNPTQFGANEDFDNYPSTPEEDARLLAELGVDALFLPDQETMYPGDLDHQTVVYVPKLGDMYCGQDRPEHFYGVTTVVSRLFNMVQPDIAVFGNKDYQQISIIRRLVEDLSYPVQIVGVDTVRDEAGLALSSRNNYLSEEELRIAPLLRKCLLDASSTLLGSDRVKSARQIQKIEDQAKEFLRSSDFKPQYFAICRQRDLLPAAPGDQNLVILAAARLGGARLIDNIEVNLK